MVRNPREFSRRRPRSATSPKGAFLLTQAGWRRGQGADAIDQLHFATTHPLTLGGSIFKGEIKGEIDLTHRNHSGKRRFISPSHPFS